MGHTIIFKDEIDIESVQDLIDQISQYEYVNLYFSTNGGYISEMMILINYLNERYKLNSIKVTLYDDVISAGTLLLTSYEGPLFISPMFRFFQFHAPDVLLPVTRREVSGKIILQLLEEANKEYFTELKSLGLNKKELSIVEGGGDVFINKNELSRIKRQLFSEEETIIQYKLIN
jgi:hypothetical protein